MTFKAKSHFSANETLTAKLARCLKNFDWQIKELDGWHYRHWDPGPHSAFHRAAAAGCGFTNKDADDIAEEWGKKHLEPKWRYRFVLLLTLWSEAWIP